MGSFVFKWDHPAKDVYVTGTFDNWSKSERLVKTGDVFEKDVTLKSATEKIYYKFVVDGNWVTDHTAPQENDEQGNLNNVLTTDRIVKHTPETAGLLSGVTPSSTTANLAKDVPKEGTGSSDLPGSFPETPATEPAAFAVNPIPASDAPGNPIKLAAGEPVPNPSTIGSNTVSSTVHDDKDLEEPTFGVAPIPASTGAGNPIKLAAGEPVPAPSTIGSNTISSTVHDDESLKEPTFGVAPIPASTGLGNPVKLGAGESVPHPSELTANTVDSTVTTDKASYENASGLPPRATFATYDLPPVSKNLIPESSLPMGTSGSGTFDASPTIQSAGPTSTTAQLAAKVPLEKDITVPEVVKESQAEAGVDPEASAISEEVAEKSAVEKELLAEVPKAPVTSDGSVTATEAATAIGAAAVALGGAAAATAYAAKDKAVAATQSPKVQGLTGYLPESIQQSIQSMNAGPSSKQTTSEAVPEEVKESLQEAGQSPEAAAYAEPVAEKAAVEKELLSEIKPDTSSGEAAPKIGQPSSTTAPEKTLAAPAKPVQVDSRDISPTTVPGSHTQSGGIASAPTDTKSAAGPTTPSKGPSTPAKDTPSSSKLSSAPENPAANSSAAADKKAKRRSFFGKIKEKLSSKDKK